MIPMNILVLDNFFVHLSAKSLREAEGESLLFAIPYRLSAAIRKKICQMAPCYNSSILLGFAV